jgi:hypothetical protein
VLFLSYSVMATLFFVFSCGRWCHDCTEWGTDPEPKIWAASPVENTPWGPNQAVRSIPGGHRMEGLPPSWSLHRVMASLWGLRVQVRPSHVLHGSEPWALAERWHGPHGRPRAGPSPNRNPGELGPPLGRQRCR